jgi:hypothetical protein
LDVFVILGLYKEKIKIMKKSKIIIPALAMLVMSTAATVTGTVAWFTMNTTASAEGMVVAAKTSGSLIIKEAAASNASYPSTSDRGTKVIFNNAGHQFYPSTLDWSTTQLHEHNNTTGLKRLINGQDINYETGTRKNNTVTLDYDYVDTAVDSTTNESNGNYYFDYGVFLCGDGLSLPGQEIKITLSAKIGNGAEQNETFSNYPTSEAGDINSAISVAFYGQAVNAENASRAAVSSDNYLGNLNLKPNYQSNVNVPNSFIFKGAQDNQNKYLGVDIPLSGSNTTYAITMRVYYDGALVKNQVSTNDYAVYTQISEQPAQVDTSILYYSDNQGTIVNPGASVVGLWKVDTSSSTTLYARSIEVANLRNMSLDIKFETTNVTQPVTQP